MADEAKAKKLAAARKRLKEYQKNQSNKKNVNETDQKSDKISQNIFSEKTTEMQTPIDSMESSTHSTLYEANTEMTDNLTLTNVENPLVSAPIDNNLNIIFADKKNDNNVASSYFDSILPKSNLESLDTSSTYLTDAHLDVTDNINENNDPSFFISNKNSDTPDVSFGNLNDYLYHMNLSDQQNFKIEQQPLLDVHESECALQSKESIEMQKNAYSNTESLRQLSSQLNSLVQFETSQNITVPSNLELRNQELAGLLEAEQSKTNQLNLQIREYITRINQLETEANQLRNEHDVKLNREMGPLQEQLQYHVQTVGILVGEKTELTMSLNQSQSICKQKTSECEELQGRLKASRHRVSDLEKEILHLKSAKENLDKGEQKNNMEFEKLRLNYNLLQEEVKEFREECSELKEKLNAKVHECLNYQQEIQEKNSQLALIKIRVEQLSNSENIQYGSQLEILNQQKISLEQQITELTQSVMSVDKERDQANQQYQQYVQQLNTQIQNLSETLEAKNNKIEMLAIREQSLVKHIGDIEKHLQQLQEERHVSTPIKHENEEELKKKDVFIQNLELEKSELERKVDNEIAKQNEFMQQMEDKDNVILELKSKIEQLSDQPDASKLLATIESDKVAASRAVEQNRKLKEQLEELHDGFIKMSNSKLELTEQLQSIQHQNKELIEKLAETTKAIEHLHVVIASKDNQLKDTQSNYTELEKQILQQNQLIDRLRHYEAQSGASDFLQEELQQARIQLEQFKSEKQLTENSDNSLNALSNDDQFCSLLKDKILKLEESNADLQKEIKDSHENRDTPSDVKSLQYLDREIAMEQLEDRFKKTMVEVADLTDEKQRLEHLVLQLQSETETIGEYVTLYQCQRAMLKEKTLEKDEQLKQLAHDKEELKFKLDELNVLVQKLVVEKGRISNDQKDLLINSNNVCDIHKQIPVENISQENQNENNLVDCTNLENNNENYKTAEKIIELLSEIKTNNLVQPKDSIQNFHPCPWCSGQLITV